MTQRRLKNVGASVRQRLLNWSRERGEDFQKVLFRYAVERLLYRLTRSPHRHRFVLKGATLFSLWSESPHRSTQDLDLWSRGESSIRALESCFQEIFATPVEDDGIEFSPESVRGSEIRIEDEYLGVRLRFLAHLAGARIPIQVDVGFGDDIRPRTQTVRFPTLLPFPEPEIRIYPREAVIAEKFQAMVTLGMGNTRMKDFYDLFILARDFSFRGEELCLAIRATFERRDTPVPTSLPLSLTAAFHDDSVKGAPWRAFLRKHGLTREQIELADVAPLLRRFLLPPAKAVAAGQSYAHHWQPGGPWQPRD